MHFHELYIILQLIDHLLGFTLRFLEVLGHHFHRIGKGFCIHLAQRNICELLFQNSVVVARLNIHRIVLIQLDPEGVEVE